MNKYFTRNDMERMIKIAFQMNRKLLADGFSFRLEADQSGVRLNGDSGLMVTFEMHNHSTMLIDFRIYGEVMELTFKEFIDLLTAEKDLKVLRG